jgi:tetratricopeptide (TPR) repeat protein
MPLLAEVGRCDDEDAPFALRPLLGNDEARLDGFTKADLVGIGAQTDKLDDGAPGMCDALIEKGRMYVDDGKNKYASLMFMSAIKLMESIGLGRSAFVVPPVSALADLYSAEGMDEEAIALYKQAYSIEKDSSGPDAPALARHLQKLGAAYEKQGKMEAATLTLEEAGSVLEHAHGPDHPEVIAIREQLALLIEPEEEEEEELEDDEIDVEPSGDAPHHMDRMSEMPSGGVLESKHSDLASPRSAQAAQAMAEEAGKKGDAKKPAKAGAKPKKGDKTDKEAKEEVTAKGAKPKKGAKGDKAAKENKEGDAKPKKGKKSAAATGDADGEEAVAISSIAQQASPIGMGHREFLRIQLIAASTWVKMMLPSIFESYAACVSNKLVSIIDSGAELRCTVLRQFSRSL